MEVLLVFLGGGSGACLRMLCNFLAEKFTNQLWPGTLLANTLGCLILFLLYKYFNQVGKDYHFLVKIGFLGSLTTFSTFAFEVSSALVQGRLKEAALILALNMFIGIIVGVWVLR